MRASQVEVGKMIKLLASLWWVPILLYAWIPPAFSVDQIPHSGNRFTIDNSTKNFLLNGHPFVYASGSVHYYRIHPSYWNDRLKKIRAGGFNTIQMYVDWSLHEASPGKYDFEFDKDIEKFIQLAKQNDLYVILRPGPYIDAELDMGGLPYWLLQKNPDVKLRTSDPKFLTYVDQWFNVILPKLANYTIGKEGPIIMVQIENEYGAYALQTNVTDTDYLLHLRDLALKHLDKSVLLFTTDSFRTNELERGKIPGVYSTVDFGIKDNVNQAFANQRAVEPNGPFVNSEFYVGWPDSWSYKHNMVDSAAATKALDQMLSLGANVNLYMLHGGTSFGFSAGSDLDGSTFQPCLTSYDYDAPITEAGDLTKKFFDFQKTIQKYIPQPPLPVNATSEKGDYGTVTLTPLHSLLHDNEGIMKTVATNEINPKTFEAIGQSAGIVLYETVVNKLFRDPAKLSVPGGIKDRGYVFVDNKGPVGMFDRMSNISEISLSIKPGQKLQIFVENMGRVSYGPGINDFKGITSKVTLNDVQLTSWTMKTSPWQQPAVLIKNLSELVNQTSYDKGHLNRTINGTGGSMSFWHGEFKACDGGKTKDTFLQVSSWKKGVAFINGFNLGRYWPVVGPQLTLYVPAPVLNQNCSGTNSILLFEQDQAPCSVGSAAECQVRFTKQHQINGPVPVA